MTDRYRNLNEKPFGSEYLLIETIIDHAVDKVWPHALDIPAWMTDHRIEPLAGEPGKSGHLAQVFSCDVGPETPKPHYHLFGIAHVIPFKLIALEVFPEKGGSYGDAHEWIAFDSILFTEIMGSTRIAFLQIHVHQDHAPAKDAAARARDEQLMHERLTRYFENLKRLVAKA